MPPRFEQELRVAVQATRAAGQEVARLRANGVRYGRKDGHELVSEADLRAAEMLYDALANAFPDTGWLSEEHDDTTDRLRHDRVWIVDPIDGTREYLLGLPEYAVSVGLAVEGRAALGVVYNPATDELFAADCTDAVVAPAPLLPAEYTVLAGRGEHGYGNLPRLPAGARTIAVGSVAYRLALLSAGKGDTVLTAYGRSEWDVAAGAALCLAAGLRTTDVLGGDLVFNQPDPRVKGLLVARSGLHRHILDHFRALT